MTVINKELRRQIVDMVCAGKDGHIPSAFSIVDIINVLYRDFLKYDAKNPEWQGRDYFVLSKGHGCLAQYVALDKFGFVTKADIEQFCKPGGILGEHPDCTKVPGAESSSGSLGHGFPFSTGIALGLRIDNMDNKVFVLCGDGECNEGSIWEAALVCKNMELGNICVIVDNNLSASQVLPMTPLAEKWKSFGWETYEINGHDEQEISGCIKSLQFSKVGKPKVIIANTIKGKGVKMLEGHGSWHHRIPNQEEYSQIMEELK